MEAIKRKIAKTKFEEIRVQVSISYDIDTDKKDDENLFNLVEDVEGFEVKENQMWGSGCLRNGFVIFVGDKIPSEANKKNMIKSVNKAISKLKIY